MDCRDLVLGAKEGIYFTVTWPRGNQTAELWYGRVQVGLKWKTARALYGQIDSQWTDEIKMNWLKWLALHRMENDPGGLDKVMSTNRVVKSAYIIIINVTLEMPCKAKLDVSFQLYSQPLFGRCFQAMQPRQSFDGERQTGPICGNKAGNRYSPLTQINKANVNNCKSLAVRARSR